MRLFMASQWPSGCKDIKNSKFEFRGKTQFLCFGSLFVEGLECNSLTLSFQSYLLSCLYYLSYR